MADVLTRRAHLAQAIQHMPEPIRAVDLAAANAAAGFGGARNAARLDARWLTTHGHLVPNPGPGNRTYTRTETPMPRPQCHCAEPDADPYDCPAEPEDCVSEFSELNPFGSGARPVNERSTETSRVCPVCRWSTSVWHVNDGSAEAELHGHVKAEHGGSYEAAVTA